MGAKLVGTEPLASVFRQVEAVLPQLRQKAPHLVPRLAQLLEWTIIRTGYPEDIRTYGRVFGLPPSDPALLRMVALGLERHANFQDAHRGWQEFEKSLAASPTGWSADDLPRLRALVWCHMGEIASMQAVDKALDQLPPALLAFSKQSPTVKFKPTAVECFQRALPLAPDLEMAYLGLFAEYQRLDQPDQAVQIARQYLERKPDHLPTLKATADLFLAQQKYGDAIHFLERACQVNPLDRQLRSALMTAHLFDARSYAEAKQFDTARAKYEMVLASDAQEPSPVLCKWAACEFKAGNPDRAEELLQQARQKAESPLGLAYNMLIETIRLKLPKALKTRLEKEFNGGLAATPTAAAAADLAAIAGSHHLSGVKYPAQKAHEKKVFAYLEKAKQVDFTEAQLVAITGWLMKMKRARTFKAYLTLGRQRFPEQPRFPLFEVQSLLEQGSKGGGLWRVQPLLDLASALVKKLPNSPENTRLIETIAEQREVLGNLNPLVHLFDHLMSGFKEDDDEDWDDEEDSW
jgi:tetratricopeptide (TPR) repeat protein